MGAKSQRKGRAGELELARILQAHGYDVSPGIPVSYGQTPDLVGLPGVHVEVKRVERLNVPEAMKQAERAPDFFRDGAPAVFHRRNRSPWLVTMKLTDWLKLYESGQPGRSSGLNVSPRPLPGSGHFNGLYKQAEG